MIAMKTVTHKTSGKQYAFISEEFIDPAEQAERKASTEEWVSWHNEEWWGKTMVTVQPINAKTGQPWQRRQYFPREDLDYNF